MERVGYAGGTLSWTLWFFIRHFVAVLHGSCIEEEQVTMIICWDGKGDSF